MSRDSIIQDIKNHIKTNGDSPSDWYVGITSSTDQRLFVEHNVDKKNDAWILKESDTENIAREVEKYFTEEFGTKGDQGGGINPCYVYAYKITDHSKP